MATIDFFSNLPDDILMKIIFGLDLKDWGRLACVSKKSCSILHDSCYEIKCTQTHPALVSDLLSNTVSSTPPGGWAALFKVLFCCPGLAQVGVNVEVSPENDAGDDDNSVLGSHLLYEQLGFSRVLGSHLDWRRLGLSCEQGNKLLDDRFSRNCLYVSIWPGCGHIGRLSGNCLYFGNGRRIVERHIYQLFRGIFINFKETMIWRALNTDDGDEYKVDLKCAYCSCKHTWDLYSPSGYKQNFVLNDGAFVCENGHVFGAWTNFLYENSIFCCKTTWLPNYSA